MQTTPHATAAPRRGRLVGLFLALLLQAGFVWALVAGLSMPDVTKTIEHAIEVVIPKQTGKPPPQPLDVREVEPTQSHPTMPPIIFDEGGDRPTGLQVPPGNPPRSGPADSGPLGIAATHTTPPYPPIEQRLGHQGTVLLRLTISPQGTVIDAVVVRSSGYERLDEVARSWVLAHWRYRPAVRGGVAVPSSGTVSVTFDLRNAG